MGLIGGSGGKPDRRGRLNQVTVEDFPPFSHDRHFSARSAYGYRPHAIDNIVVIGGSGQIVAVEQPASPIRARRRKGALLVPAVNIAADNNVLRFLWGPARSLFGVGSTRPGAVHDRRAAEDHMKYKTLHQHALESVGDIALQAFLRFLEARTDSGDAMFAGAPRCNLAFRFQYDEHYLHERHAAQLAWKRFLIESLPSADQKVDLLNSPAVR